MSYNVQAHHFIGGVYAKEVKIADGFEVMQHAHNYDHMSVLAEGCVVVWEGEACETYYSPAVIEIKAGVEHRVVAVNGDVTWLCIHATSETDETKVDDVLIKKQEQMIDTGFDVDVSALQDKLNSDDAKYLWNQHPLRTQSPDSPHYGCDDIWVRYKDFKTFDPNNPKDFEKEGELIWYDSSLSILVDEIARSLYSEFKTIEQIGGILITRIPPGGKVLRHSDAGRWHAEYFKNKYLIPIQCDENQSFCYDNERHVTQIGRTYCFNNLVDHWVDNNSNKERISLIICTR